MTYSTNFGNPVIDATNKDSLLDILTRLPNNTAQLITPEDVRNAVFTTWEQDVLKVNTHTGVDHIGVNRNDYIYPFYFGRKNLNNTTSSNPVIDQIIDTDADYYFYNMKDDNNPNQNLEIKFLAGDDTSLFQNLPTLEATVVNNDRIDLNVISGTGFFNITGNVKVDYNHELEFISSSGSIFFSEDGDIITNNIEANSGSFSNIESDTAYFDNLFLTVDPLDGNFLTFDSSTNTVGYTSSFSIPSFIGGTNISIDNGSSFTISLDEELYYIENITYNNNDNTGIKSLIIGDDNNNSGSSSTVGGINNENNANNSVILGENNLNDTDGNNSLIIGLNNINNGDNSIITGFQNESSVRYDIIFGRSNNNSGFDSIIGGFGNTNSEVGSIVSGLNNDNNGEYSIISGQENFSDSNRSLTIGLNNNNSSDNSIIAGNNNSSSNKNSFIFGQNNLNSGFENLIIGRDNQIVSSRSSILAGQNNIISTTMGPISNVIVGGLNNNIDEGSFNTIINGSGNTMSNVDYSTISGENNIISNADKINIFGSDNECGFGSDSFIIGSNNTLNSNLTFISGLNNNINNSSYSVILGGQNNSLNSNSSSSVILGGNDNSMGTNSYRNVILGGQNNTIENDILGSSVGSVVTGRNNYVTRNFNFTLGEDNDNTSNSSLVLGNNNNCNYANSIISGTDNNFEPFTFGENSAIIATSNTEGNRSETLYTGHVNKRGTSLTTYWVTSDTTLTNYVDFVIHKDLYGLDYTINTELPSDPLDGHIIRFYRTFDGFFDWNIVSNISHSIYVDNTSPSESSISLNLDEKATLIFDKGENKWIKYE